MMINRGKSLLLIGDKNAGKSSFLQYLKNCFGEDRYSFLSIKMSRGMQLKEFEQIMYKKLKVTIQPSRQKQLESVNGKRLICMVDDFNLLE